MPDNAKQQTASNSLKETFERRVRIPAPASDVFAWHERPEALRLLIPPGDPVRVVSSTGGIRDGARVVLVLGYAPFQLHWVAVHRNFVPGVRFTDVQEKGPFKSWEHTHTVEPDGPCACTLVDHVEYELPFGSLGKALGTRLVRSKLNRLFDYRHRTTLDAFSTPAMSPEERSSRAGVRNKERERAQ